MRVGFRNTLHSAAALAALSALALGACDRQTQGPGEASPNPPSNAEREAEIAAEQLAALGGPASAETRALYEGEFQASGGLSALGAGEGAWELRLLEDYAQFVRPGLGQDGGLPGERDYREHGMRVVAGPLTITLRAEECPIGNGVTLPYFAHVLFEGVAYQGCARRGVAEGERPSWASVLGELLPAIDACMARVSSRPARITTASALDEELVSVRLREADGSRRECIAAYNGTGITAYEPVSDLDRVAGEGDPEFQRGGSQPRAEECKRIEAANDSAGQQIGWLVHRSC